MTDDIDRLRAEVAALRTELAEVQTNAMSRRRLLMGLAGLGAAGATGVTAATPASAADGDPMLLGERNEAADITTLTGTEGEVVLFVRDNADASPGPEDAALSVMARDFAISVRAEHVGVAAIADGYAALSGWAGGDAAAVRATATLGIGVDIEASNGVPLRLHPGSGPPPTGPNVALPGSMYLDNTARLWLCTAAGPPAAWTQVLRDDTATGRVVPITPIRAIDSRAAGGRPAGAPAVPGQKKGPLKGGSTITLDLAGVAPLPSSASGVIGNLTVVSPSYAGYLVAGPSGTTPITSALNFPRGATVANAFTSALGPNGLTIGSSGTASNTYELIVDITAYVT